MHPTRKRRLIAVLVIIVGVGAAAAVTTWSLRQNMLFFVSPADAMSQDIPAERQMRLGGLVETGSVQRSEDGLGVSFTVTDGKASIPVQYDGILPDLFREGQGVIARGHFDTERRFVANEVLAKHDENYMPPEVAEALREAGHPGVQD
jgi:cytochrome c-type biogenesis protein CcmE